MKEMPSTPVFLLHGLGSHAWTLWPLAASLRSRGYTNCHCIEYPVDRLDLEGMVDHVDGEMQKHADVRKPVILIGQSMGGVVANRMHTRGWKVRKAVYIGSPLHGARLLTQLERLLPTWIRNALYKKPYGILMAKEREQPPPHAYHTFSMGWLWTAFDGCVYTDEATLDPKHHTHLPWADHRTVFANPRLWCAVGGVLDKI